MPVTKAVPVRVIKTQPVAQELEILLVKGLHGLPREFCTQWSSEPHHPSEIQDAETAYSIWSISNYPACEQAAKKCNRTRGRLTVGGRSYL